MLCFTNTVTVRCTDPRAIVRSGGFREAACGARKEFPANAGSVSASATAASGREVASVANAEAPREHLAPGTVCEYVPVIMIWTTKRTGKGNMNVDLLYGRNSIPLRLPDGIRVTVVRKHPMNPVSYTHLTLPTILLV